MTENDRPRGRQLAVCELTAAGQSAARIADTLACSESTVRRTRAAWRPWIDRRRDEVTEDAAARLLALVPAALDRLARIVDGGSEQAALGAARYVTDAALRWRDQTEVERRLAALESHAEETTRPWVSHAV